MSTIKATPLLRWVGSKRAVAGAIAGALGDQTVRLIEPFAGSAAVFFAGSWKQAVLSDANEPLMQVYRGVRDQPSEVWTRLCDLDEQNTYDGVRSINWRTLPTPDCAAWMLYLNAKCYNGIYRENRLGFFNVPEGKRQRRLPSLEALKKYSTLLADVELFSSDVIDVLGTAATGDLVYLDPPYPTTRKHYGLYGARPATANWLDELRVPILRAADRGAAVCLSMPARLLDGVPFEINTLLEYPRRGRLNGNNGRGAENELLVAVRGG